MKNRIICRVLSTLAIAVIYFLGIALSGRDAVGDPVSANSIDPAKQIEVVPVDTLFDRNGSYGITIGINRYASGIQSLDFAAQDAQSFFNVMTLPEFAAYKPDNFYLFNDSATDPKLLPSRNNILEKLLTLKGNIVGGDTFYFFFSGHGLAVDGENYLVCSDTLIGAPEDTAISFTRLYGLISQIDCRKKVIILDACRNELETGKGDNTRLLVDSSYAIAEGTVTFFSTAPGERSYEDPVNGHGVFTEFLLEALKGKGDLNGDSVVSVNEIVDYVFRSTVTWANANNRIQKPWKDDRSTGDIPVLVLGGIDEVGYSSYESVTHTQKSEPVTGADSSGEHEIPEELTVTALNKDSELTGYIDFDVKPETTIIYIEGIPAVFPAKGKVLVKSGSYRIALCADGYEDRIDSVIVPTGVTVDLKTELSPVDELGAWIFDPDGFRLRRNVPDDKVLIDIDTVRNMALGISNVGTGELNLDVSGSADYKGTLKSNENTLLAIDASRAGRLRILSSDLPLEFWPYASEATSDRCSVCSNHHLIQPAKGAFAVYGAKGTYYRLKVSRLDGVDWTELDERQGRRATIVKREYYIGPPVLSSFDKGAFRGSDTVFARICIDGKKPMPGGEVWVSGKYDFQPPLELPEGTHRLFVTVEYGDYYNTFDWAEWEFYTDCVYTLTYNLSEKTFWLDFENRPKLNEEELPLPAT